VNAFHPEVVRASVGTLFTLPLSVVGVPELVTWARANGIRLIVTTPATDELYFDADVSGPVAVVVGSEKNGITDAMRAAADVLVRIPMSDGDRQHQRRRRHGHRALRRHPGPAPGRLNRVGSGWQHRMWA